MTIHLSLSGGMDSTTLLSWAARTWAHIGRCETHDIRDCTLCPPQQAIETWGFNYGQRHVRELESARAVANWYDVPFRVLEVPTLSSPALTEGGAMPHGHYSDESMSRTVVQGRNLLFAAMLIAQTKPGDSVALGVHAGDHAQYPDCRPEFWLPFTKMVRDAYDVGVFTPFLRSSKASIATIGMGNGAPLALSWSCYEGGTVHCGRCGTCVERAEAFHVAGVEDPTEYADPNYWRQAVADYADKMGA